MKYIIISELGIEVPIMFADIIDHSFPANGRKVLGAGKVKMGTRITPDVDDDIEWDIRCSGESHTLGVKSRGNEDAAIIEHALSFEAI
jgi:hypothetical protein